MEQPNIKWNSQTLNARSNGTAKCQMEQKNIEWNRQFVEWNRQTSNGTAKRRIEQPNVDWNRETSNGTDKRRVEQQESNGLYCSHGDDHDVNPDISILARNCKLQ